MTEQVWAHWLGRIYNLRRDKRGLHERPHKPVPLLAIIDLLDRGAIEGNTVPFNAELVQAFRRWFGIVRAGDDRPNPESLFHHLAGDRFWEVVPAGRTEPLYQEGVAGAAPTAGRLRRMAATGRFDAGPWELLRDPIARHPLREALISRYFPGHGDPLAAIVAPSRQGTAANAPEEGLPPRRDAAFRRTILHVYDHRCAACRVRVPLAPQLSLVEASHLIPFSISHDDRPTSRVARCPNHHGAMDRHLIAPCPAPRRRAGVWRVNERRLDDRIEGQRDLVALAGRPDIAPGEEIFPRPRRACRGGSNT